MARTQFRSRRKASGGRYRSARSKRQYELADMPTMTKADDKTKSKIKRTIGGSVKRSLLTVSEVNVAAKGGKMQKTKVINVVENPANANLVRRNIITKGAVVETELGKVKITSRPGQEGSLNGVLL